MNAYQAELYHYGIKNQKWGERRFQNEDGSLTPAGKKRYGSGTGKWGSAAKEAAAKAKNKAASDGGSGKGSGDSKPSSSTPKGRTPTYGGQGKPATKSGSGTGGGPVGSNFESMGASIRSRSSKSSDDGKIHTSSGNDRTVKSKGDFDVGSIRESVRNKIEKTKEENRKNVSAMIGPDSSVSEISNTAYTSNAVSYTSNSSFTKKSARKVRKSKQYNAGMLYVQQMIE